MEFFLAMVGFAIFMFVVFQLEGVLKLNSINKVKVAEANRDKARAEVELAREQNKQITH